jgi:hypothetical protein
MGAGFHGGFGNTQGSQKEDNQVNQKQHLPKDESQLKHIFKDKPGHLKDTPENRKTLVKLANNKSKYVGKDKYGNSWNIETTDSGVQNWVRYQNGTINEGGQNQTPRKWDNETGLNHNPVKRRKKNK